jgi:hypothetical protein
MTRLAPHDLACGFDDRMTVPGARHFVIQAAQPPSHFVIA